MKKIVDLENDCLEKCEWRELMQSIASVAVFEETKTKLTGLNPFSVPFLDSQENLNIVQEVFLLEKEVNGLVWPQTYNVNSVTLKNVLARQGECEGIDLFGILSVAEMSEEYLAFKALLEKNENAVLISNLLKRFSGFLSVREVIPELKKSVDVEGNVLPSASPEYARVCDKFKHAQNDLRKMCEEWLQRSSIAEALQENYWTQRDGRFVLPVKAEKRSSVPGVIRGMSSSGSTVFIEPHFLQGPHARVDQCEIEMVLERRKVLQRLSALVHGYADAIIKNIQLLVSFDDLRVRLTSAKFLNGCRPMFVGEGKSEAAVSLKLMGMRHPLMLYRNRNCIAQDLSFPSAKISVGIISGPNAGGKTLCMRTLGLILLMAKAGFFVPAHEALLPYIDHVFVEMGDRQSTENDLSSFSGHLDSLQSMLPYVKKNVFLFIDEGFAGTEPGMGAALARAFLEKCADLCAFVLMTTHFQQLKQIANEDPRFYNLSLEFEANTLRPTYRLLLGIPGQSYALELAERMNFPLDVLKKAQSYRSEAEISFEKLQKELQAKQSQLEDEKKLIEQIHQEKEYELGRLHELHETWKDFFKTCEDETRNKLQRRLNLFLHFVEIRERRWQKKLIKKQLADKLRLHSEDAKKKTENGIAKDVKNIKEATAEDLSEFENLTFIETQVEDTEKLPPEKRPEYWKPGMRVKCARVKGVGEVLKGANKGGLVECKFGLIKTKISHKELEKV